MTVLAIILAVICIGSVVTDIVKMPMIVASMDRLRISPAMRQVIPVCKTLGAAGLLIGLKVRWLGILAAVALTCYFLIAAWFHNRAKDPIKEAIPAIVLAVFSAVVAALAF